MISREQPSHESFETSPERANDERLLELLTIPPELNEGLLAALQDITGRALAVCVNPHEYKMLMMTANIACWRMLGRVGDPLPLGLVYENRDDGKMKTVYDKTQDICSQCVYDALEVLLATYSSR